MPDGSLSIIDCGVEGRLDDSGREKLENLVIGVIEKDTVFHIINLKFKNHEN